MLKDKGFMATVIVGSAMSSGGTLKAKVTDLGIPNCAGGTLQVTPVSGISNLTVSVVVSSGIAYIKGAATGVVGSGTSGTYHMQVVANGAKVTLT